MDIDISEIPVEVRLALPEGKARLYKSAERHQGGRINKACEAEISVRDELKDKKEVLITQLRNKEITVTSFRSDMDASDEALTKINGTIKAMVPEIRALKKTFGRGRRVFDKQADEELGVVERAKALNGLLPEDKKIVEAATAKKEKKVANPAKEAPAE